MASSHGGKKMWCVPEIDSEYRERMNELLSLYEQPYDPKLPVVCLDEKNVELHGEKRQPINTKRGKLRDHEYVRNGTANVFMITEPKGGRHYARVTKRRTKRYFAMCLKWLDSRYPNATTIHLVMDNLNTHRERALIETFGENAGRRLWARFTPHYTPKHASWLNQAEIAIGVMARCCLGKRRFEDINALRGAVVPFWRTRRREKWTIEWRFTIKKAKHWLTTFVSKH